MHIRVSFKISNPIDLAIFITVDICKCFPHMMLINVDS